MTADQPALRWAPSAGPPAFDGPGLVEAVQRQRESAWIVQDPQTGRIGVGFSGSAASGEQPGWPVLGLLPPLYPEWLGDRGFTEAHGLRFPYVGGEMANGISTPRMVVELGRAGMLGFFGAAGLSLDRLAAGLAEIDAALGPTGSSWGTNLIHSPAEPALEAAVAELYVRRGVRRVSASAYLDLTLPLVRLALTGLGQAPSGRILRRTHIFAKISRPEVAARFLQPAPAAMVAALVEQGLLTEQEARLAREVAVAEDVTVEADSGGHTDNQALPALFPVIAALRDRVMAEHGHARPIRVGAAGGLGRPSAVAAAFGMGAAYVLTGTVNQACLESGLHASARAMLAQAGLGDVGMCPAADMFEQGVDVQVLTRGTMFAVRARRLYQLYRQHRSLDALPADERLRLEREILGATLDEAWASTRDFWLARDPAQVERAESEPRHRMALVFRAYLGQASRWAIEGRAERRADFQVWCGPAIGAFNDWTAGTFLADAAQRSVVQVARNLLEGAAVITRACQLRSYGISVPAAAFEYRPRPLA